MCEYWIIIDIILVPIEINLVVTDYNFSDYTGKNSISAASGLVTDKGVVIVDRRVESHFVT